MATDLDADPEWALAEWKQLRNEIQQQADEVWEFLRRRLGWTSTSHRIQEILLELRELQSQSNSGILETLDPRNWSGNDESAFGTVVVDAERFLDKEIVLDRYSSQPPEPEASTSGSTHSINTIVSSRITEAIAPVISAKFSGTARALVQERVLENPFVITKLLSIEPKLWRSSVEFL